MELISKGARNVPVPGGMKHMTQLVIRKPDKEETEAALGLVRRVFLQYEAPDYSPQGVEEFEKTLRDEAYLSALSMLGAFLDGELIGVIATRDGGRHIALFFVDTGHQRQGVGRRLFRAVRTEGMTVNSSPYAVPVYTHLGFVPTGPEQEVNGLRFTPMTLV